MATTRVVRVRGAAWMCSAVVAMLCSSLVCFKVPEMAVDARAALGLNAGVQGVQRLPVVLDDEARDLPGDGVEIVDNGADVGEDGLRSLLPARHDREARFFELPGAETGVPARRGRDGGAEQGVQLPKVFIPHLLGEEDAAGRQDAVHLRRIIALVTVDHQREA